jgi:hypothetical protein
MGFQPQIYVMHGIALDRNIARICAEISQSIHQFREIPLKKGLKYYVYMENYFSNENIEQISLRMPT